MKAIPYVTLNGNCEEAIQFYHSVLGGTLEIMRYSDLPSDEGTSVSESWKNKIMHSCLAIEDGCYLYFGDTWEDSPVIVGTNSVIHLQVNSEEDVYTIAKRLSEGGEISMPPGKTFWNSVYGSFIDKFGIGWGIEFEL